MISYSSGTRTRHGSVEVKLQRDEVEITVRFGASETYEGIEIADEPSGAWDEAGKEVQLTPEEEKLASELAWDSAPFEEDFD